MLPDVQIPEIHSYDSILERARAKSSQKKPRAALTVPSDIDALRAFTEAARTGLVEPTIIGDQTRLEEICDRSDIDIGRAEILNINQPDMAVRTAARMASAGELDIIVQGRVLLVDLLRLLFDKEQGFRMPGMTISHVAVMKPQKYPKLLMLTDSAVVVLPDLKTKLALISNLVSVSKAIGIANPRTAVIGAVEVVYPQMPATVEAAVLAKMSERGQIKGAQVDGPLSFDTAVDMFAAHSKGITTSAVAGQADALVAPGIEVASGVYNAMSLYGRCEIGGVLVGGRVPVAVNPRADSEKARFNSIALAVLAT